LAGGDAVVGAAVLVSVCTGRISVPLTYVVMPRLRSARGPVIVTPGSLYVSPRLVYAGLLPFIEITGDKRVGDDGKSR
jgi:hypothetical protein